MEGRSRTRILIDMRELVDRKLQYESLLKFSDDPLSMRPLVIQMVNDANILISEIKSRNDISDDLLDDFLEKMSLAKKKPPKRKWFGRW